MNITVEGHHIYWLDEHEKLGKDEKGTFTYENSSTNESWVTSDAALHNKSYLCVLCMNTCFLLDNMTTQFIDVDYNDTYVQYTAINK